ncbi:unnamed protein product [Cunninghamella echinulata]
MTLPNEILTLVFQHFNSRRYLITASLVCQQWNLIITNPIFYKHITIYTYAQLTEFIKAATRNLKHHHKPMGHYVQQLAVLCDDYIKDSILKQLEHVVHISLYCNFHAITIKIPTKDIRTLER